MKGQSNDAKKYLERIKWCDVMIDSKLEELGRLNDLVKKITPVMSDTSGNGSGNQDKLGETIAKIVDLKEEVNNDTDKFIDLKHEANALLEQIERPEYYQILHKRYIQYKSLEKIAGELNYSWRWVCKLHGRALQAFEKVMKKAAAQKTGHISS